jgi:hypothetical protein
MRAFIRRALAIPALLVLVTAGLVGFTASAAQAGGYPSDCFEFTYNYDGSSPDSGSSYCGSGGGHFRVQIYCTSNPSTGYPYIWVFGPYEISGGQYASTAQCTWSYPYATAAATDSNLN